MPAIVKLSEKDVKDRVSGIEAVVADDKFDAAFNSDIVDQEVDVLRDLSGEHPDGETHNYGVTQQVETGHLTETFSGEYLAEIMRWGGSTGLLGVRQYATNPAFKSDVRRVHSCFAAINLHDHSNYESMPGIGELAMMVNGYYYRTRHNDYKIRKTIQGLPTEHLYEQLNAPPIKASVLAKPTGLTGDTLDFAGDTQAKYFKEQWTNNPEDIEMHLAYIEVWFENSDGTGERADLGLSDRHADAISNIRDALEKGREFNASGIKDRYENTSFAVSKKNNLTVTGLPAVSNMQYRIMCAKVGTMADIGSYQQAPVITISSNNHNHVLDEQMTDQQAADLKNAVITEVILTSSDSGHAHVYTITWNGTKFVGVSAAEPHPHDVLIEEAFDGSIPFDKAKALAGTEDATNMFSLVKDQALVDSHAGIANFSELVDSTFARFSVDRLDRMCERCPGLDGEGAYIHESRITINDELETYTDPDGGVLNSAYYNRRHGVVANDAAGRNVTDRFYNDSTCFVAMNTKENVENNVSYMIPLELLARSSIEHWNPYAITEDGPSAQTGTGGILTPYEIFAVKNYNYKIPKAFYTESGTPDPADTGGALWMRSQIDQEPRLCYSSGIRPFTHDGVYRTRFPIFPFYWDYNPISTRLQAEKKANDAIIADLTARIEALET